MLAVALAVVVAVQDKKAEKGRQGATTFSVLQDGVGRSRPTATTIGILNRCQLPIRVEKFAVLKDDWYVWLLSCCNFMFFSAVCR